MWRLAAASKPAGIQPVAERLAFGGPHGSWRIDSDRMCCCTGRGVLDCWGCARAAQQELLVHSARFDGAKFGGWMRAAHFGVPDRSKQTQRCSWVGSRAASADPPAAVATRPAWSLGLDALFSS